jgi:Sulfotransferase domain
MIFIKRCINKFKQAYRSSVSQPPAFIIIGAQKAGTTALYEYLSKHPSLKASRTKELDFFSCDELYSRGIDYYHSQFPRKSLSESNVTFEASPSYLASPTAASRIYKYNSSIKLLVILREPCSRAFSAWNMYRKYFEKDCDWFAKWMMRSDGQYRSKPVICRSQESLNNFTLYIKEELEANANFNYIEAPVIPQGLYHKHLTRYLEYFNRDQIHIITNDRMRSDIISELNHMENFLNIEHHNWINTDLSPVFYGGYKIQPEKEAVNILLNYYSESNFKMEDDFGIKFT